jgi:hypothetical protein
MAPYSLLPCEQAGVFLRVSSRKNCPLQNDILTPQKRQRGQKHRQTTIQSAVTLVMAWAFQSMPRWKNLHLNVRLEAKRFSPVPQARKRLVLGLPGLCLSSATNRDFRDIMAETESKDSNLAPGMRHSGLSGSFSPKLTQKERKRLQQQQQQQQQHSHEDLAIQQNHSSPQSPWQTPSKQPGSIRRESLVGSDRMKTAQKLSMTMRQTIAGTPPANSNAAPNTPQSPVSVPNALPLGSRSVKPTPISTGSITSPTPSAQPAINLYVTVHCKKRNGTGSPRHHRASSLWRPSYFSNKRKRMRFVRQPLQSIASRISSSSKNSKNGGTRRVSV